MIFFGEHKPKFIQLPKVKVNTLMCKREEKEMFEMFRSGSTLLCVILRSLKKKFEVKEY